MLVAVQAARQGKVQRGQKRRRPRRRFRSAHHSSSRHRATMAVPKQRAPSGAGCRSTALATHAEVCPRKPEPGPEPAAAQRRTRCSWWCGPSRPQRQLPGHTGGGGGDGQAAARQRPACTCHTAKQDVAREAIKPATTHKAAVNQRDGDASTAVGLRDEVKQHMGCGQAKAIKGSRRRGEVWILDHTRRRCLRPTDSDGS